METKDVLTLAGFAINAIGLIAALVKFAQEQKKANVLRKAELDSTARAEKRTEYKLRIYLSLLDNRLRFEEIVNKFNEQTPVSLHVDQVELRKSLYEMLIEGTLVAFSDKTYSADTIQEDEDEDDVLEDEDDVLEDEEEARYFKKAR